MTMESETNARNENLKMKQKLYKDLACDKNLNETLPKVFAVKYLGKCPAQGMWGIEFTRRPVEDIVAKAKAEARARREHIPLPAYNLEVSEIGVKIVASRHNKNPTCEDRFFPINLVSYGVQDSVYKAIFAMIVIRETTSTTKSPFDCYCFCCDNPEAVSQLIRALAMAFKLFIDTEEAMEMNSLDRKTSMDIRGSANDQEEDAVSEVSEA